jgi:hypothetical protein
VTLPRRKLVVDSPVPPARMRGLKSKKLLLKLPVAEA